MQPRNFFFLFCINFLEAFLNSSFFLSVIVSIARCLHILQPERQPSLTIGESGCGERLEC